MIQEELENEILAWWVLFMTIRKTVNVAFFFCFLGRNFGSKWPKITKTVKMYLLKHKIIFQKRPTLRFFVPYGHEEQPCQVLFSNSYSIRARNTWRNVSALVGTSSWTYRTSDNAEVHAQLELNGWYSTATLMTSWPREISQAVGVGNN